MRIVPTPSDKPPYEVAPDFVVRVAGLPMEALRRLRFDRTMELIDESLELEAWLREQGEMLSEELYGVVGGTEDRELRRALISLRRSIYNGRAPRSGDFDERVRMHLPEKLSDRIALWCQRQDRRAIALSRARTVLEEEEKAGRSELRRLAGDESFQNGLLLSSRDFYPELQKWLRAKPEQRTDRKLEIRLVRYFSRAASKTSPYSTFTSSAEGRWVEEGSFPVTHARDWCRRGVVELGVFVFQLIGRELSRWPEIREQLPLRVNSSLLEDGDTLTFLGHDEKGGEAIFKLAATPMLRRVLRLVRETGDGTYNGVIRALSALDPEGCTTEVSHFLGRLTDVGLLQPELGVADQSLDHLGRLAEVLGRFPHKRVESIRELLLKLRAALENYESTPLAAERSERMGAVQGTLRSIYGELGWGRAAVDAPKGNASANAFYEDTLVDGIDFRCSLGSWRSVLDDLSLLQRLAGLYGGFLPGRLAVAAFFADHYGPGADESLLEFHRVLRKEMCQPGGWRPGYRVSGSDLRRLLDEPHIPGPPGLEHLDRLDGLKREVRRRLIERPLDDGSPRVRRIDRRALRDFVSALPDEFVRPAESVAFFCQVFLRDGEPSLVLNNISGGFGRSLSRLRRVEARAHGTGGPALDGLRGRASRAVYAEIEAAVGTNVNLRVAAAPHAIDYPGNASDRPLGERLPLSDLRVVHDPREDRLRLVSERLGREVVPLHLGTMVELLLPPAYRFLVQAFGRSPSFSLIHDLKTFKLFEDVETVEWFPRLCLGNVIVSRAFGLAKSGDIPVRRKGEPALDHMLRVTRWRREHEIPERCFVRAPNLGARGSRSQAMLDKSRKPMWIDFSNGFSLQVFDHMARESDPGLILEEALPDYEDLVVTDGDNSYVSECVFELALGGEPDG